MKNTFALFLLSILLLSVSNCGSTKSNKVIKLENNPPFTISEIFAQDWVAGVKEGDSGTNVHITFDKVDENLKIENIYFDNKILLVRQPRDNSKLIVASYKTAFKRDIIMDSDPTKEAKNTPEPAFPFDLGNKEAVIQYNDDGTSKYFKVSDVLIKPLLALPAANRN